ncbi:hypothetical protein ACFV2N_25920 [Streptomyces sp. NPDC059680]|uniref:hypothetical protein n=1 Tax=Streptomyces sp. NPDC059680 TaxID=3346904 RepID=UPI0036A2AE56
MSGADSVGQHHRRRLRALVQQHPGSTAAELSALLSAADRSMLGLVLRAARECCEVRTDDEGRYWAT